MKNKSLIPHSAKMPETGPDPPPDAITDPSNSSSISSPPTISSKTLHANNTQSNTEANDEARFHSCVQIPGFDQDEGPIRTLDDDGNVKKCWQLKDGVLWETGVRSAAGLARHMFLLLHLASEIEHPLGFPSKKCTPCLLTLPPLYPPLPAHRTTKP